jgi:hypothetical protein
MTKLAKILSDRQMTYKDFQISVFEKTGYYLGFDRISKIVNGKQNDILLSTAKHIADTLDLKIDDII